VRRVLARLDADALDATLGRWLAHQQPAPAHRPSRPARPVRALAIDGKTLRGSAGVGKRPVHLLAAMDHASQVVLAQVEVATTLWLADTDHTAIEVDGLLCPAF
jgi:hypothetical protein